MAPIRPRVEIEGDGIIITLPGTTFRVIYRKPLDAPGLVASALRTPLCGPDQEARESTRSSRPMSRDLLCRTERERNAGPLVTVCNALFPAKAGVADAAEYWRSVKR